MARKILNALLAERVDEHSNRLIHELVADKLREAGFEVSQDVVTALVSHSLSGSDDPFTWGDEGETNDISNVEVKLTDSDLAVLGAEVKRFAEEELSPALEATLDYSARKVLKRFKADWPEFRVQTDADTGRFTGNLDVRWGEGFNRLRMLHAACLQIGDDKNRKLARSKARKERVLKSTLIRLHARSMQVGGEIITLLTNGYADGAFARWRTLHEIAVVATVLAEHGEDLAVRYVRHRGVENWNAMNEQDRYAPMLGHALVPKGERARIEREYEALVGHYGPEFATPYGWAAHHLARKRPNFGHLEEEAGRASLRPYYKMASYNVHAGPNALFFQLGLLRDAQVMLAGPSNAGLSEPAQNAAIDLARMTSLLYRGELDFDDIVSLRALAMLRDEIQRVFARIEKKLAKEDQVRRASERQQSRRTD